jgi:hypothetical protein
MLELGKEARIRELLRAGYEAPGVLRQMQEEGAPTSKQEVYKVKHRMRREGYVFPEGEEKPTGGPLEVRPKPTPSKGKGSRSPEARYRKMIIRITQRQRDLEFAASTQPGKIPDYAVDVFSKIEEYSEEWRSFKAMVHGGGLRDAVREALTLVPSYERSAAIEAANGRPPPKIAPYVSGALSRWMERFKEEKRGDALPRGRVNRHCHCGTAVLMYYISPHRGSKSVFEAWCPSCHEAERWRCDVCGSTKEGLIIGDRPCVGCHDCGHLSDFDGPVETRCPKSMAGYRLWDLLLRNFGTLKREACWSILKWCEGSPSAFREPYKLYAAIATICVPQFDYDGVRHFYTAELITNLFFRFNYRPP